MYDLELKPGQMTLSDLRACFFAPVVVSLHSNCQEAVKESAALIAKIVEEGHVVYGVNTGFGKLAQQTIPVEQLETLQENLVLSHAAGTGALLDDNIVRLIMILKINALAQGYSGVRPEVIDALVALVNHNIYPCIPSKGSVGASGDLAPLAHMSMVILGYGEVRIDGQIRPAAEGLKKAALKPLKLAAKEGLALLNGTQVSTALAVTALLRAEDVFMAALLAGALSVDAAMGSPTPFRPELQDVRRQPGQISVAKIYRSLLEGSEIRDSHRDCGRVQDPYCLRCMPQVMGACRDHMAFVAGVLEHEINAVSDNPLVFTETGEVLSGGNFHAEPVAMAADTLALVIAETGSISERRIATLIDENQSGLPAFLVKEAGLNSGFMIAHVTAAALVSENKQLSHPACVDSIATSANQEDHVSMATHGARRLLTMVDNTAAVVAIELLAAAQGIEFHRPLKTAPVLEEALALIREKVPHYGEDRYFAPDIEAVKTLVTAGRFNLYVKDRLPLPWKSLS